MAGPPEFAERAVGLPGLEETYGVTVGGFEPIADGGGPATVDALVGGDVQAANIFSTNPAIEAEGLVVLDDPEGHFAAQNVVPVVRQDRLTDEAEAALDAVSAELTTDDLVALNLRVSGDGKNAWTRHSRRRRLAGGARTAGLMIEFEGVSKTYPDGTTAIEHLDFSVSTGSLTVFVGPSGCGKTRRPMRMINRMIEADYRSDPGRWEGHRSSPDRVGCASRWAMSSRARACSPTAPHWTTPRPHCG